MNQATPNKSRQPLSQLVAEFPRRHLIIASMACALLFIALLITPGHQAEALRTSQTIEISLEETTHTLEEAPSEPIENISWTEITVKPGDNLSKLFLRAKLADKDVYEITHSSKKAQALARIYPGQKLFFHIGEQGQLLALKHQQDILNSTLYERNDKGFSISEHQRSPELRQRYVSGTISSSLYLAASKAGLQDSLIMEMASVFGGVIDFVYDIREGDSFTLLFEEKFIDGKKIGNGPILAAEFSNQGDTHKAYRYQHASGDIGYYNEEGISMRKAFLRAPLDFTRISSSFNPNRLHPVFKTKRPHRGIDYAAATGTPVYAAGDGRVVKAGYTKANGNFVVIKHGESYTTKYLHLNKRAVKSAQRVKQRQIIGWVGSTGYATGPHLHYEFLVNGVHRNPRTILNKLPKASAIASNDRTPFLQQVNTLEMQMATYKNHYNYAANTSTENNTL